MDNETERAKGKVTEIKGAVKESIGDLIGNEQMQAEGYVEKVEGQNRQAVAKAGEQAKGISEEISGKAEGTVGKLIGNEQMQVEGKAKELKGEARQKANQ
ncbi:CsbD family protein [Candidatus Chloroploca asiatica]|uniref:General stress protein CsbD n=1 Tax=Candidatus Chloroploca asiatica TaxID=1506545 RepID=A0A2H3KRT9_9CHLR|nr:CsbD family protein [Candidatus Chloroploca asiatica]PDW01345.1 general stress protein CsbD [Candidatus Chloroploca asiatica]